MHGLLSVGTGRPQVLPSKPPPRYRGDQTRLLSSRIERIHIDRIVPWCTHHTGNSAVLGVGRRVTLLFSSAAALALLGSPQSSRGDAIEYRVPKDGDLVDIIQRASSGSVIYLEQGEYAIDQTLDIQKPLTVRGSAMKNCVISLSTDSPYHPVIQISSTYGVTLENLTIRHRSPSIANNYALYLVDAGDCTLCNMDVSSSTGTGIGIEGIQQGVIRIQNCTIHDCARNGIGLFPSIEDTLSSSEAEIVLQGTQIEHNKGHGLVVKGMHDKVVITGDNEIHFNKLFGVKIADSESVYFSKASSPQRLPQDVVSKNGSGDIGLEDDYSQLLQQ